MKNTKMNKNILFVLFLLFFVFSLIKKSWSQDLLVIMNPKQIDSLICYDFLKIELKNNSNDTIFISLEPYNYGIINNSKDWLISRYSNTYSPNRIYFINKKINDYNEGTGNSYISYLRFPKILYLAPENKTSIFLYFDNNIKKLLKGNNWYIIRDIWYAYKNEINTVLKDKPEYLKCEFEKALYFQDSISISLCFENNMNYDSSLFLFNNDYYEETIYDEIIYNFNHCSHNFDYELY